MPRRRPNCPGDMPTTPNKLPLALLALYPALRSLPAEQLAALCLGTAVIDRPGLKQVADGNR